MNDAPKFPVMRPLAFTFLAALAGTLAGVVFLIVSTTSLPEYARVANIVATFLFLFVIIGIWAVPIWLLLFLPICAFLPRSSRLWYPLLFSVFGSILGAGLGYIIIGGFYHVMSNDGLLRDGMATGAVVSGVAFFGASVTREKFRYN